MATRKLEPLKMPTDRERNPLLVEVPRDRLRHHMILSATIEQAFRRIEREYAARDRLAHHGLPYSQKILLYGPPGCGKTMGVERLAWNIGLPLLKVRFDSLINSYLGETGSNLRSVFEFAAASPCVLLIDECDAIARARDEQHEVGEIKRVVNMFLQILDEYQPSHGLVASTTNLADNLDYAIWRRFDVAMLVPMPSQEQRVQILQQTLAAINVGDEVNWEAIATQMEDFPASEVVKAAQNAAKRMVIQGNGYLPESYLVDAIKEIRVR